jgi:uncharacterized protein
MSTVLNLFILLAIGMIGWAVFELLHFPIASLLGPLITIGILRVLQVNIPMSPSFLHFIIQVVLGLNIGLRFTRDTLLELKQMILPSIIIIVYALTTAFGLGSLVSHFTVLDIYTSILSSSIGGLPEMTILAIATGSQVTVVVLIQTLRMVTTLVIFPLILKRYIIVNKGDIPKYRKCKKRNVLSTITSFSTLIRITQKDNFNHYSLKNIFLIALIASSGGFLFFYLNIPAGAMVGSMFFTSIASLCGVISTVSLKIQSFTKLGVGIMVSNNISSQTVVFLTSANLLFPIGMSISLTIISSLAIAYLIFKLTSWDLPTCFLAAAPAGLTVMAAIAIENDISPFKISILHFCRLFILKSVVPFVFMFLIKRI